MPDPGPLPEVIDTGAGRFGWCCGIAGAVLVVAGFFAIDAGGTTPPDGSVDVLAREITDERARIIVGSLVGMFGAALLLVFVAAIYKRLAEDGETARLVGITSFGFGVIATGGAFLYGNLRLAATAVHDPTLLAEGMRALAVVIPAAVATMFFGLLGMVTTMSVATFRGGLLPRPFAWVGCLIVASTVAFAPTDHGAAVLLTLPWLAGACVALLSTRGES
jgi:hypothetical protein